MPITEILSTEMLKLFLTNLICLTAKFIFKNLLMLKYIDELGVGGGQGSKVWGEAPSKKPMPNWPML